MVITLPPRRVLLVGLGNYSMAGTRHNAGSMALDWLSSVWGFDSWSLNKSLLGWLSSGELTLELKSKGSDKTKEEPVYHRMELFLLRPKLFMNVNGRAVAKAVKELGVTPLEVIVLHDDLQRELGKISRKAGGSANGHNGILSVMEHLRIKNFRRLRIGIGRPESRDPDAVGHYVLSKFTESECQQLESEVFPSVERELKRWLVEAC